MRGGGVMRVLGVEGDSGFVRFLQGPDTDQNTVQQIRDAIKENQDITVQLLNYTKTST